MKSEDEAIRKFKGRPLFENLHKMNQTSLLSHTSIEIDLKGFFNLVVILICTTNFVLVFENFKNYGTIISMPTSRELIEHLPLLVCLVCLNVSVIFSWFIERYVSLWLYNCVIIENKKSSGMEVFVPKDIDDDIKSVSNHDYLSKMDDSTTNDEINNDETDKSNGRNVHMRRSYVNRRQEERCSILKGEEQREQRISRTISSGGGVGSGSGSGSGVCELKKRKHGWKNFHLSIFLLKFINSIYMLNLPYLTVSYCDAKPVLSAVLLTISIVWFFKIYSFHDVCYDTRKLYIDNMNMNKIDTDGGSSRSNEGGNHINKRSNYINSNSSSGSGSNTCGSNEGAFDLKGIRTYPHCLKLKNYYTYILMPTMCFQYTYPRTEKIRWMHVVKHIFEIALLLLMMKIISDQYVFLTLENTFTMKEFRSANFSVKIFLLIERMLKICIPTLYIWLLGFLVVFHHWCNLCAELTRFGDRLFYKDWWNASSLMEYWRKWNLPIHYFVSRHINKPLIYYGFNKNTSMFIVFLISAILHEYIISIPLKLGFSGYFFFIFIAQVPLMQLTNYSFFKKHKTIGNSIFWVVFCVMGQPLILFIYYYSWSVRRGIFKD
ncbi:diacylglycerol O-acyltransferase [Plasmodium brasilianum]|uniref:O-acyltransferase n=2 Tax=Plasmodium (Plasmodium) TaxID=418103 RepID=A0A1A8VVR1_PLAMA|nr:diacylglycerol O-acyltransferase, putative [Plasmodium malariae]KAI4838869.1 diacylglycerol O-acyltransferase [Plasmodium brasilianum]SBS84584.1 diacylglycerol O-acyltransferase, putative (DGAT) [Plasmodium malariae]SCN12213.1 diacylglycerol O-acyltransferase, putative [Plasmodium malariae]